MVVSAIKIIDVVKKWSLSFLDFEENFVYLDLNLNFRIWLWSLYSNLCFPSFFDVCPHSLKKVIKGSWLNLEAVLLSCRGWKLAEWQKHRRGDLKAVGLIPGHRSPKVDSLHSPEGSEGRVAVDRAYCKSSRHATRYTGPVCIALLA